MQHVVKIQLPSRQNQRLSQSRVVIGQLVLRPGPFGTFLLDEETVQPIRHVFHQALHIHGAVRLTRVIHAPDRGECQGSRRHHAFDMRNRAFEKFFAQRLQGLIRRMRHQETQGPDRSSLTILRSTLLQPLAVIGKKVAEYSVPVGLGEMKVGELDMNQGRQLFVLE